MKQSSFKQKYLIFKVRQHKDPEAYGELYDYYVGKIYRFILFKVATSEEAEDLTSEVFLKTWEYINSTSRKIENLNALFYKVARNCVIDYYRKKNQSVVLTDEDQMDLIEDKKNSVAKIEDRVDWDNLQTHLIKLKDVYREVLLLRYSEDFSINEISEIVDKSPGNVRIILHRALNALKEITSRNT